MLRIVENGEVINIVLKVKMLRVNRHRKVDPRIIVRRARIIFIVRQKILPKSRTLKGNGTPTKKFTYLTLTCCENLIRKLFHLKRCR